MTPIGKKLIYLAVNWIHSNPDEPVSLYSELDENLVELRKVEVFADGTAGYAGPNQQSGNTRLAILPLPSKEEIETEMQFQPRYISRDEFEEIWKRYTSV